MSFTGNLEDLAIVDVIQLLHSAKKSGTLTVRAGKRESQLVFDSGYMISANHPDDSYQIGKILVEMKALTAEVLELALEKQKNAGESRKPLIGMLIESGLIDKEKAFRGLEFLIEMTIVEMVTWTRGTFTLDVDNIGVSDEYRYFPETLRQDMNLDTQMVLMDALRIFDEKKRDGEIVEQIFDEDDEPVADAAVVDEEEIAEAELIYEEVEPAAESVTEANSVTATPDSGPELSADLLGLDNLDQLDTKIPEVFTGLRAFDPADIHCQALAQAAPALSVEQREALAHFLTDYSTSISIEEAANRNRQPRVVLLYSDDDLLRYALMTVCKHEGVMVFVVDGSEALLPRVEQTLAKGLVPLAVFDLPTTVAPEEQLTAMRQQYRRRYPQLKLIQLISPDDERTSGQAYLDGAKAVFARPTMAGQPETFGADLIRFLETLLDFTVASFNEEGQQLFSRLNATSAKLVTLREPPALAFTLLQFVAEQFSRSLTLVVGKGELIAERGFGLQNGNTAVVAAPPCKIPLDRPSVFRRVIEAGELFYGPCDDALLQETLLATIGAPVRSNALLLPMQSRGRTISLTYADFGPDEPLPVVPEAFEILARQAGLVLENLLYRKQLSRAS